MKPCVSTVRYGAAWLPASDNKREDWNQPRCWSLHSRYMSHWNGLSLPRNSGLRAMTAREDDPESIHTSSVSADLLVGAARVSPSGLRRFQSSPVDFSNQTLDPCCSISSAAFRITRTSSNGLPWAS